MLQVMELQSEVHVEPTEFRHAMLSMRGAGWTPAALESQFRFWELAGIPERSVISGVSSLRSRILPGQTDPTMAEVFFRDDGLYYCVNVASPQGVLRGAYIEPSEEVEWEPERDEARFLVGVVSDDPGQLEERLRAFAELLGNSMSSSLGGRKARQLKWEWQSGGAAEDRLEALRARLQREGAPPRFSAPHLDDAIISGAEVLADTGAREMLLDLAAAGFVREEDILARRGRKAEEVRRSLDALKSAGLIVSEYVLTCRGSSAALTKLTDPERLQDPVFAELVCANCNRKFGEELLSEKHAVSPVGRQLITGAQWLTVWVTKRLLSLGVPLGSMVWNTSESGEEVDILVDFLDRLWILELKDREFGPADAHPFNYRRARYRAPEAMVITTQKVSTDVKRAFEDLARESRPTPGASTALQPVVIEGLDKVEVDLRRQLERAARMRASQKLRVPSLATGYDLTIAVTQRYPSQGRRAAS